MKRLILRVKGSELGTSRRRRLTPDLLAFGMMRGCLVEGAGHFYCLEHEGVLGSACQQGGGLSSPQARPGTCVDPFFIYLFFLKSGFFFQVLGESLHITFEYLAQETKVVLAMLRMPWRLRIQN